MAETTHNKQFEIVIAILGMIGGGILPFPELIGWGFLVFAIVNFLSIIFFAGRKMYWLAASCVLFCGGRFNWNMDSFTFKVFFIN